MNVLIVEDNFAIAELLQEQLEIDGYCICGVARTVREAVDSISQHEPDFAVVDLHLADGDLGTDVAVHLRRTTNAGIIFSTGDSPDLSLLRSLGDAVITKPYQLGDLDRGLKIIAELARFGQTELEFPSGFQLLVPVFGGAGRKLRALQDLPTS